MSPAELAKRLDDSRPYVRSRAIHQLAKLGSNAVAVLDETLKTPSSAEAHRNAVWALTRIDGAEAREAVRGAMKDQDESVRQAALHSASVWRDARAFPQLMDSLRSNSPNLQRAAAEALGRIGDKSAVAELLAIAGSEHDRVLDHSLIYALIEIADPVGTASGLHAASSKTRRAALIALDQMDGGGLKSELVTPLLVSTDPVLKQTAWWIASHHSEWGRALAGFFRQSLAETNLNPTERDELQEQLAQFGGNAAIQELLAATAERSASKESRLIALRAMTKTRLKETPRIWTAVLVRVMSGHDADLIRQAVSSARAWPAPKEAVDSLIAALLGVARNTRAPVEIRLDALAAIPGGLTRVDPDLFDLLCAGIEPTQPVALRSAAASTIEKAKLSAEQLRSLTDVLKSAGPLELPKVLAAFDNGGDEALGLKMIAALRQSKGLSSLRADVLVPRLAKYPASVQKQGEELLAFLNMDMAKQKAQLDELLAALKDGDIRRGQVVFNSQKAACYACHAIGYLGGKVGPDLTKIGQIRNERDLLEAIVYPDASFVRSYEPVVVVTKSGEKHSGVLRKDASDEVVLATSATDEARIARTDIAEIRPGTVSVMPSGLDQQLTHQELADLLAFMKAARREAR